MPSSLSALDFLKTATHTAHHFGFNSLEKVKNNPACRKCIDRVKYSASASERRSDALHGMLTGGMCSYFDNKMNGIEGPILFYSTEQVPRSGEAAITLQVFGVKKVLLKHYSSKPFVQCLPTLVTPIIRCA